MLSRIAPARCGFVIGENMKSFTELAEEYKAQADHIEEKMDAIPSDTEDYSLKRKRAVLWSMWCEAMDSYYKLKDYYKS